MAALRSWDMGLVDSALNTLFTTGELDFATLPPVPQVFEEPVELPDACKQLMKFLDTGFAQGSSSVVPLAAASKSNMNSMPGTPKKALTSNVTASASQSAGLRTPKSKAPSPVPQPGPRTPKSDTTRPQQPAPPGKATPLPAGKRSVSRSPSVATQGSEAQLGAGAKRHRDPAAPPSTQGSSATGSAKKARGETGVKIIWPAHVPTDAELRGDSRSKLAPYTTRRIQAQEGFDPDFIFAQPAGEMPLTTIFQNHPAGLARARQPRTLSGNWANDTFTAEEEDQYKRDMGFKVKGPSQVEPATLF